MHTNGRGADPMGIMVMDRGDPCPACPPDDAKPAVHMAVIPLVDEGGDIVLPHLYAVCCACHKAQHIRKYGPDYWQPCGCESSPTGGPPPNVLDPVPIVGQPDLRPIRTVTAESEGATIVDIA